MSTSSSEDVAREAGPLFRLGRELAVEDAAQRRLHYHLLRLTVVGLAQEDMTELSELGRLAFSNADTSEQSARIKRRAGAGALAVAIAGIVDQTGSGQVMLGAVLGAYAAIGANSGVDREAAAVMGAVGGATAASAGPFVLERIGEVGLPHYLSTPD